MRRRKEEGPTGAEDAGGDVERLNRPRAIPFSMENPWKISTLSALFGKISRKFPSRLPGGGFFLIYWQDGGDGAKGLLSVMSVHPQGGSENFTTDMVGLGIAPQRRTGQSNDLRHQTNCKRDGVGMVEGGYWPTHAFPPKAF